MSVFWISSKLVKFFLVSIFGPEHPHRQILSLLCPLFHSYLRILYNFSNLCGVGDGGGKNLIFHEKYLTWHLWRLYLYHLLWSSINENIHILLTSALVQQYSLPYPSLSNGSQDHRDMKLFLIVVEVSPKWVFFCSYYETPPAISLL